MSEGSRPTAPYVPVNKPTEQYIEYNGAKFYTEFWPVPEGTALKGRVVWLHGFSEFSKVYLRIFDDLSQAGYEVFFFDQRGAGYTSPGKLKGITDEFHTFDDLDFFLKRNIDELESRQNKNLFLMGHSMGGGISLNYGIKGKYKDYLSGIAVTGPLVLLHPSTRPGKILYGISYTAMKIIPNYRMDTKLKEEYITSDPEWSKFLLHEPVSPLLGSLKQIYDFLKRGERLLEPGYADKFSVPLLILHGDDDHINDFHASEKFVETITIPDKRFVPVKGSRHSIMLERKEIYESARNTLLEWLSEH